MTYDHWKSTNPNDEFLGPAPHECEECYEPGTHEINEWTRTIWLCDECHAAYQHKIVMAAQGKGEYIHAQPQ